MTTHASRPRLRLLAAACASLAMFGSVGALADTYQLNYKIPGLVKKAPVTDQEPAPEADTDFTSHTFTTCGQSGRFGPTLEQCQNAYTGAEILEQEYAFAVTSGIQEWTVPVSGMYRIEAYGASGGAHGGLGAKIQGEFSFSAGQHLKILVGQQGASHNGNSSGGGGGTFLATADNTPLLAAGGGSGGINGLPGTDGVTTEQSSQSRNYGVGYGGRIYKGDALDSTHGSGGSGFNGDGQKGGVGSPARSFVHGGIGATGYDSTGWGGFGGGGGYHNSGSNVAGGGGGYTGGHGNWGFNDYAAGGGGSFNSGSNQVNQAGANSGQGRLTITLQP